MARILSPTRWNPCLTSTSSRRSKSTAIGSCFPFPATPKAITTGMPCPGVSTSSSGAPAGKGAGSRPASRQRRRSKCSEESGMNWKDANSVFPDSSWQGRLRKRPPLHVAVQKYLAQIEALKKPNTHRKYEAVLDRFVEFFRDEESIDQIGPEDLTRYIIALKKDHNLGANTILHNAIIVAQFFKRQGRGGITRALQLPERITPLPREYRTADF